VKKLTQFDIIVGIEKFIKDKDSGYIFTMKELIEALDWQGVRKSKIHYYLQHLIKEHKLIKKQYGQYQVIGEPEFVDFDSISTRYLDIDLPFNIQRKIKFFAGNILIFSCTPGTGKTYLAVNLVKHFIEKGYQVDYYSSEPLNEFKLRLLRLMNPNLIDETLFRVTLVDPYCFKLKDSSLDRIVIWDWLDLANRYHLAPFIMRKLVENHRHLLILFMQAKEKDGRPIIYGQEGSYQLAAAVFYLLFDKYDKDHRFPILYCQKVRSSPFFRQGSKIYLQFDDNGLITPIECYSDDQLRQQFLGIKIEKRRGRKRRDLDEIPF